MITQIFLHDTGLSSIYLFILALEGTRIKSLQLVSDGGEGEREREMLVTYPLTIHHRYGESGQL